MRTATTRLGLLVTLVLFAAPAWAQTSNVTFQVDMNTALTNCALDPATDSVLVRGSFNDWSDTGTYNVLQDLDEDGIFAGTVELPQDSTVIYKFYAGTPQTTGDTEPGYEDGTDRTYTVTSEPQQTIPVVEFNKPFEDLCDAETATYEIIFQVDMSVQTLIGAFDPETDVVTVAGDFNGFATSADTLVQDIFNPDIYIGSVEADFIVPSEQSYKYVIGEPEDAAPDGWEGGADRTFQITGDETDDDGNGIPEAFVPVRYFDDVTPDDILIEGATVVFEVDLRPAYYHLADEGILPSDTQTGEPTTSIDGLFINGPVAGSADDFTDWATWGPDDLGQIETRELVDDGTNGDAVAGDSIFTITYEYDPGTPKLRVGKFGINGFDNEGGFGGDHNFRFVEGAQSIDVVFGAILQPDGTYVDDNGPVINDQDFSQAYDPYILIDNDATPPTVTVVRSGGEADNEPTAVEPTGVIPTTAELRGNYPNPFVGRTTFEYAVAEAGHVSLTVYDLMGRRIATLVDGAQAADTYRVDFDATGLASGVYVTRLQVGGTVLSQKLTVTN